LETQIINWDSFQFKIETLDETKANMIKVQISIVFAPNVFKMKWGAVEEVFYGCIKGLESRIPECKLRLNTKWLD